MVPKPFKLVIFAQNAHSKKKRSMRFLSYVSDSIFLAETDNTNWSDHGGRKYLHGLMVQCSLS